MGSKWKIEATLIDSIQHVHTASDYCRYPFVQTDTYRTREVQNDMTEHLALKSKFLEIFAFCTVLLMSFPLGGMVIGKSIWISAGI